MDVDQAEENPWRVTVHLLRSATGEYRIALFCHNPKPGVDPIADYELLGRVNGLPRDKEYRDRVEALEVAERWREQVKSSEGVYLDFDDDTGWGELPLVRHRLPPHSRYLPPGPVSDPTALWPSARCRLPREEKAAENGGNPR
jgi:hypothetical protein